MRGNPIRKELQQNRSHIRARIMYFLQFLRPVPRKRPCLTFPRYTSPNAADIGRGDRALLWVSRNHADFTTNVFGTKKVGTIYRAMLTAWSAAAIAGRFSLLQSLILQRCH